MFYLSCETAGDNPEEGEDDAKSARPLTTGAAHVIQWLLQRAAMPQGGANPIKNNPSSDWSLQLDSMKPESLVNVNHDVTLNMFLSLVLTARHAKRAGDSRSAPQGELSWIQ